MTIASPRANTHAFGKSAACPHLGGVTAATTPCPHRPLDSECTPSTLDGPPSAPIWRKTGANRPGRVEIRKTRAHGSPSRHVCAAKIADMAQTRRVGGVIGTRYAGNTASYDPDSGRNYRTAVTLKPDQACAVIAMAHNAGMSVSGVVNAIVKNSLGLSRAEPAPRPSAGGAAIGTRYRGNTASYDPDSGRNYRTGLTMEPLVAVHVLRLAEEANRSVSGYVNTLVTLMTVDADTGLPPYLSPAPVGDVLPYREAV